MITKSAAFVIMCGWDGYSMLRTVGLGAMTTMLQVEVLGILAIRRYLYNRHPFQRKVSALGRIHGTVVVDPSQTPFCLRLTPLILTALQLGRHGLQIHCHK